MVVMKARLIGIEIKKEGVSEKSKKPYVLYSYKVKDSNVRYISGFDKCVDLLGKVVEMEVEEKSNPNNTKYPLLNLKKILNATDFDEQFDKPTSNPLKEEVIADKLIQQKKDVPGLTGLERETLLKIIAKCKADPTLEQREDFKILVQDVLMGENSLMTKERAVIVSNWFDEFKKFNS